MDPLSLIITALALGAAAGLKPTAESAIKDAYAGLKTLIQRKYRDVNVDILEKDPASKNRQEVLAEDLTKAQADHDDDVLAKAKDLIEVVRRHQPGVALAVGVDLRNISGDSLKVSSVSATGESAKGVSIEKAEISGDIEIKNVRARSTSGRPTPAGKRRFIKKPAKEQSQGTEESSLNS